MYLLLIRQFTRSKAVVLTLILILAIGVISIFVGRQFLLKQEKAIAEITVHQREHIERNVTFIDSEMGLLLYYLRFPLINQLDKLSALSIGQRDVNPSIQNVTIRNLEGQRYDTDLNNPSNLLSGNLDLGFVIIYLFPLIIIAFTFNLLSEEKETGTWSLVAIQSKSTLRYLFYKLSVKALLVYSTLNLLFLVAIVAIPLPINEALLALLLISMLYLAFWFALCFCVISFNRNSSFNALTLLSLWVFLAILLPASLNNFLANKYPVPESLSTMVKQRDGLHEKYDMDKKITMDKFHAHYPEFKKYTLPDKSFSWLWYYAMQQMGDDESLQQSKEMRKKIVLREKASRSCAFIIPTMHVQLLFNDIAKTSLSNHLQFLDKTNEFHEKMRLYFYPKIFENTPVKSEDWNKFKPEYVSLENETNWLLAVFPLIISTALISLLAAINLTGIFGNSTASQANRKRKLVGLP
jgi:ABC-2 type transport system permease protein